MNYREQVKIYLVAKIRLVLGKKEFICLVVLENGTKSLAEDLSLKLYDLGYLIKTWFGCFLSARIRCSSDFAASSLLTLRAEISYVLT